MNFLRDPLGQEVDIAINTSGSAHQLDILRTIRQDDRSARKELVGCVKIANKRVRSTECYDKPLQGGRFNPTLSGMQNVNVTARYPRDGVRIERVTRQGHQVVTIAV